MSIMLSSIAASKAAPRMRREVRQISKIYFILCEATGRVKCGVASDPRVRLAGLQVGSPTALKLIAEIEGNNSKEKLIHQRLARWHIHGEWFHYLPEVCDVIVDEVAAHLKELYCGLYAARTKLSPALPPFSDNVAQIDPCGQFIKGCVRSAPGGEGVRARVMYEAYKAWCLVNGIPSMFETQFGLTMKKKLKRDDTKRVRTYLYVALDFEAVLRKPFPEK